jgi:hypothetical protein
MRVWSTGHSPAKGNGPGLSSGVIEGLWHWLLIWGQLHPRILVCVGMATARMLDSVIKLTCHLIYIGIIVVARHVNLWCNHTTALISSNTSVRYVGSIPNFRTIPVWDVQVEVMTWYMISCRCGLILIRSVTLLYLTCMYTITLGIRGNLYHAHSVPTRLRMHADDKECKTQCTLLSESWKGNTGAHT